MFYKDPKPSNDFFLLCEGPGDEEFFKLFLEFHDKKTVRVEHAKLKNGATGKDVIGKFLVAKFVASEDPANGFHLTKSKSIVIAVDADENASSAFKATITQIYEANKEFEKSQQSFQLVVPQKPWTTAKGPSGVPNVSILTMPSPNSSGALETLCFNALRDAHAVTAKCVEEFSKCVGATSWAEQKNSKLKLRAMLSALNEKNPDIGFGRVFRERPDLINFKNETFVPLQKFFDELLSK